MLDLLLVDPDPEVLEDQLSKRFRVRSVRTQSAALRAIRRQLPHLMVIPQELGRSSGFVLCATVRANHPEVATPKSSPLSPYHRVWRQEARCST